MFSYLADITNQDFGEAGRSKDQTIRSLRVSTSVTSDNIHYSIVKDLFKPLQASIKHPKFSIQDIPVMLNSGWPNLLWAYQRVRKRMGKLTHS
jgi:hypothetical protein